MNPNPKNWCGNAYADWTEVFLTPSCSGKCSWCIDRGKFHPAEVAKVGDVVDAIKSTGCRHAMLLGGEPTLYSKLSKLVEGLRDCKIQVHLTTNGEMLSPGFIRNTLRGVYSVNVSIHHWDDDIARSISGIEIIPKAPVIFDVLRSEGIKTRLNCTCFKGGVDSWDSIIRYIEFASSLKADSVRFSELKGEEKSFVSLPEICSHHTYLGNDPFVDGCSTDSEVHGMKVNFRTMCGLQTCTRPRPISNSTRVRFVVFYDGRIYLGWPGKYGGMSMDKDEVKVLRLLELVKNGHLEPSEALILIKNALNVGIGEKVVVKYVESGSCQY